MTSLALAFLLLWQAPQPPTSADFEAALAKLPAYEYGQRREPLAAVSEYVRRALAVPAELKKIEARLADLLRSQATGAAKDFVCRELSLIGTEVSVPALAALLPDPATSDMARYALERIPAASAGEALRAALPKTTGKVQIGVINSLGARRDRQAVPALQRLLGAGDAEAASAAITALARIGDPRGFASLAAVTGVLRSQALAARLELADLRLREGDGVRALAAYQELYSDANPVLIRAGALRGLAAFSAKDSLPTLRAALQNSEPGLQTAAIGLLAGMPGAEITALLLEALPKLAPAARVQMLAALADRKDPAARPALAAEASSNVPQVRLAALEGLARLGDASVVELLAKIAASAAGAEQAAARDALARLPGPAVDAAIVAGLGSGSAEVRLELIRAAGQRGLRAAAEPLIQSAREGNPNLRREALRALRDTAGGAQIPALIDLLSGASAAERRELERALSSALRSGEPTGVGAVAAAGAASSQAETRVSLLGVLGRTGDPQALPPLRRALGDANAEIQRAGILALGEWPGAAAAPDLIRVARTDPNAAFRVLALRGYLKLVSLPSERSPQETVKLLADGLGAAQRADEKKLVLAALPGAVCPEALALAESLLAEPEVAAEAKMAADRLRRALSSRR